jgi:PHP family Zn ribbon phosphoesterase
MEFYNIDFHIHGLLQEEHSKNLSVEKIAEMGYYKGLNISPVGDLTHKGWFDNVFSKLQEEENFFILMQTPYLETKN